MQHTKYKLVVLFEGRDSAGKGGTIKRITQRLNPRVCRVVALPAPTERERTQWYFQRYVPHLPAGGEIVLFDRSWYNRAGVERVMGFADEDQVEQFFNDVPEFERMLVRSGIKLIKYWFSITDQEQQLRFMMRIHDPMKQWKLSPMDLQSRVRWEAYTKAKEEMLERTNIPEAPWSVVEGNDKKCARLNCHPPSAPAGAIRGRSSRADRSARPRSQSGIRAQGATGRAVRAEGILNGRIAEISAERQIMAARRCITLLFAQAVANALRLFRDVVGCVLGRTLGLIGLTLGLGTLVAGHLADRFFDRARDLIHGARSHVLLLSRCSTRSRTACCGEGCRR